MPVTSRKVFSIYRTLNRDQLRFVVDKVIEGEYTADLWLGRLNRIAYMDLIGDETRGQAGRLSVTFGILSVATLVLSILRPVLFFFPITFLIIFIYFLSLYLSLLKIDISNNMRVFLVPLIQELDRRMDEKATLNLKMNFSSPVTFDKLTGTLHDHGEKPVKEYRHDWMEGKLVLKDGNRLEWHIRDIVHEKGSKFSEKAEKMKFKDYEITHHLDLKFFPDLSKFRLIDENYLSGGEEKVLELHAESKSESLEEGMDPKLFIDLLDEACSKIEAF